MAKKELNSLQKVLVSWRLKYRKYKKEKERLNKTKQKPKYRISNRVKLIGLAVIGVIVGILVIKTTIHSSKISSQTKLGYTKQQAEYILDNKLTKITKQYGYSEYYLICHENGTLDEEYLDLYFALTKVDATVKKEYDLLLEKGYTKEDALFILKQLPNLSDVLPLFVYDPVDSLETYVHDVTSDKLKIDYLHIYENIEIVEVLTPTSIINKKYSLSSSYASETLKSISNYCAFNPSKLEEQAADAFYSMCMDAKSEGVYFASMQAYRSYEEQEALYEKYKSSYGELQVDNYTPRPGHNEHQTGYAVNVASMASNPSGTKFIDTNEYAWLQSHAHEYGFIFRYPNNKEYLTGFSFEPDHLRYVGIDVATFIKEKDITLEEYVAFYAKEVNKVQEKK